MHCSRTVLLLALSAGSATASMFRAGFTNVGDLNYTGTELSKEEVMANMTNTAAVAHFLSMAPRPELISLLESDMGKGLSDFAGGVMKERGQRRKADPKDEAKDKLGKTTVYTGVQKARNMLNEMIVETRRKLDIETISGIEFEERQLGLLANIRGEIAQANADAAAARSTVLDAEAKILEAEKKLPLLKEELEDHKRSCQKDITSLTFQLGVVKEDLDVMHMILNMTQCESKDQKEKQIKLIACSSCQNGARTLAISHPEISEELKKLKSDKVRDLVRAQLTRLFSPNLPHASLMKAGTAKMAQPVTAGAPSLALPQRLRWDSEPARRKRNMFSLAQDEVGLYVFNESENMGKLTKFPENVLNTTDVPKATEKHDCVQTTKCSIANSPNCGRLQDRFMVIYGGMVDMRDDLEGKLDMRTSFCEEMDIMYTDQINELEEKHNAELARHAEGTKQQVDAERASHELDAQHHDMEKDYYKKAKGKCATKNQLTSEICALEKIRGELMRMKGLSASIQDCEVGKWIHEPCTATCGGGKQRSTRLVTMQPKDGVECPALEMEQDCGMAPCPIDCVLDDWSGWSECSAECGGGVMTRQRLIKVEQQHQGEPCGATMESVTCHLEACNEDCTLADWTDWGSCSKQCDSGVQTRYKRITKAAKGDGKCPPPMSKQRMQYDSCNAFDCSFIANKSSGVLTCKSKIDLIVAMDASASVRKKGWNASKSIAMDLISALPGGADGVKVAFLLFSGPSTTEDLDACMNGEAFDLDKQCGVKWVSRYTNDTESLLPKIKELPWRKRTTLTSMALTMAREELKYGRQDANSVVLMISDANPISAKRTGDEAREVQKQAQLAWVLVGPKAPSLETIKAHRWASRPLANNVIRVENYKAFERVTLNRIISDICPVVG